MKHWIVRSWWVLALLGLLVACGNTPEPTVPPPTQTPHIVLVTTTPCAGSAAEASPVVVTVVVTATPEPTRRPAVTPTPRATTEAGATAPNPSATAEPTQTPEATGAAPRPSPTAQPATFKYQAPVLLEPPDNRPVSWGSTVLLKWSSVGDLAEDEFYHVHLERPPQTAGQEWYGDYVFTKATEYRAAGAFLAPFHLPEGEGRGVIYWWVRVVRKTGEDENGKPLGIDLSLPSEKRTFITDPKPGG